MKKLLLFAVLAFFIYPATFAQQITSFKQLAPLSEQQLSRLAAVPRLKPTMKTRGPLTLPVSVDNSTLPYFRPLFTQSGLECGQASSIGLGLTYELDAKRGVPANLPQNQCATYFTYDFINGGSDAGVSFLESWEIVKRCGNPSVLDYGGLSFGGPARWMSGYSKYYNAMHNRITDVYSIPLNTIEGINMLRSWIYNHMGETGAGGVAHFYSQYGNVTSQLPAGTPDAGKYVITSWGSSPNHAMTILGYNDSIRWDYNGDGQFTNNIDINGDGIVDVRDWEIGGFKIANTYGNVTNWADQGFSYAMYKSFAENPASGGIWDNLAYIAYAKQDLSPKLTMKVTLKHTCRNKIKIIAGVAKNLSATEPEVTLNLPIFDFQGGDKYMQGGTTEADKTIEFGLDATPLLSEITSGQPAKFFLMLEEDDPLNLATGLIVSYELIDYTSGVVSIPCSGSNVPIVDNGLTTLTIIAAINVNQPAIVNTSLPEARIYEPFSQQMNATGGNPAYKWRFVNDYSETQNTAAFPAVNAEQLTVSNSSDGFASKDLPFTFPFYGKSYNKVFPHVDGYLKFDDQVLPWPYIIYEKTFFKNTRSISPYMSKPLILEASEGDGIWYQGDQNSATFRWKASMSGQATTTDLNFAVTLYPNGNIEFYYGTVDSPSYITWNAGISNGDGVNYHFAAITDSVAEPTANSMVHLTAQPFPTEMSITDDGLFTGTPEKAYQNVPIRFYAEDNNFLYTTKTLNFTTKGVEISYLVNSGGDSIIEYGETAHLTAVLKNISSSALHNVVLHLSLNDPFTTLIDSVEIIGTLAPGQTITFPDAFRFQVSNAVTNGHLLNIQSQLVADEDVFNRTIQLPAWSADVVVNNIAISDGNNNILMPGETGNLLVTLKNNGGSEALNVEALLSTIDPNLIILLGTNSLDTLNGGSSIILTFQIKALASCPTGHIGFMTLNLAGDKNLSVNDSIYVNIGPIVEDFETGNFTRYPWQLSGNSYWTVTTDQPYEGTYCARSGVLTDNQESTLYIVLDFLSGSDISFYRKVSSELNYDYLYFYVDGVEQGKWSGEVPWSKVNYTLTSGLHTLKWVYRKDYSVSAGSDKAWVDYISWPPISNLLLIAYAGPDGTACTGQGYQLSGAAVNASAMWWSTNGDGAFSNVSVPDAIYYPGNNDLYNGGVILTIHAFNNYVQTLTDNMSLNILAGPQANAGPDLPVCPGSSIELSQATATNQSTVLWTSSGDGVFNNPSLITPIYTPGSNDISAGSVMLTMTAGGLAGCGPVSDALILTILPPLLPEAGTDQSIGYGSSTQLNGSCNGGTGSFNPLWSPPAMLLDPTSFNPTTINLTSSVIFTLTVTDAGTGCISTDLTTVIVSGGPLGVSASATPSVICSGGSSQLFALAGGGSGNYTYLWSSNPAGFTSTIPDPLVFPAETTTYTVTINDGSSTASGQVAVTVNSIPAAPGIPQGPASVNVFTTASTDYTTEGSQNTSEYIWQFTPATAGGIIANGSNCKVQWNSNFNGIALLWVNGLNNCGQSLASDTLSITANQEIGLSENAGINDLSLYPNPGSGLLTLKIPVPGDYKITIQDPKGIIVYEAPITFNENNQPSKLNLRHFAAGIYYLFVQSPDRQYTGKICIIH